MSEYWMIWFAAFFAIEVGLLMLAVVLKWLVMGTYKAENHTFFSNFHYRWAIMLNFKGAMAPLADHLTGTAFQIWHSEGRMIRLETLFRAQISQFELFELVLLLKLDEQLPVERFEATVSQSNSTLPPS